MLLLLVPVTAKAQDHSPVFRDYHRPSNMYWVPSQQAGMGEQLYQFNLLRKANNGVPEAQNDLGLRYLLGDGFSVDTTAAVMWIRKAAEQNLYAAHYNMGLLYTLGAGLPWDPYRAFRHFRYAAENGDGNAQYMLALMYTDGLVVDRDWRTAYAFLKRASQNGIDRADEVIQELWDKGYITPEDTSAVEQPETVHLEALQKEPENAATNWVPIFLDFERDTISTAVDIHTLLVEAVETSATARVDSLKLAAWISGGSYPAEAVDTLQEAAAAGNPEATVFLGSAAEQGLLPGREILWSIQQYIHGIYLDSRLAGMLLERALRANDISKMLTRKAFENDSIAMFVWAGLKKLNMDKRLQDDQALELLSMAAEGGNITATIHLGMCYASGLWTARNPAKARLLWEEAAAKGSVEAASRIAAETLLAGRRAGYSEELRILENAREEGSLLATVALAYAYESGTGFTSNVAEAVRLYRAAAVRGSRNAHHALQDLYRNRLPGDWQQSLDAGAVSPRD